MGDEVDDRRRPLRAVPHLVPCSRAAQRCPARFRYASTLPALRGRVELTDFRDLHRLKSVRRREARCIITSPPYLDVTSFEEDQWLRLWFLGGPPHPTRNRVSRDDRHELASAYWRMVADCWRTAGYLVASRGHVVVRMAGKGLSADAVVDGLTGCAVVAGRDVSLVDWERARSPGDRPTPSDPDR